MRNERKATQHPIAAGEIVRIMTGGGGYGAPSERDPEAVRRDVREGYVSPERPAETTASGSTPLTG